jgi:hypothetical protein
LASLPESRLGRTVPFSLRYASLKRANYNEAELNSRGLTYGTEISRIFTQTQQTFKELHQKRRNGVINLRNGFDTTLFKKGLTENLLRKGFI